jgi:hypothetical protein
MGAWTFFRGECDEGHAGAFGKAADPTGCELVRDRATDTQKRELVAEVAEHLKMLAARIDHAMVKGGVGDTFLGRKTYEPFPKEKQ